MGDFWTVTKKQRKKKISFFLSPVKKYIFFTANQFGSLISWFTLIDDLGTGIISGKAVFSSGNKPRLSEPLIARISFKPSTAKSGARVLHLTNS